MPIVFAVVLLLSLHLANEEVARRTGVRWLLIGLGVRLRGADQGTPGRRGMWAFPLVRRMVARRDMLPPGLAAQLPPVRSLVVAGVVMMAVAVPVAWLSVTSAPLVRWIPGEWGASVVMFPIAFCVLSGIIMLDWAFADTYVAWRSSRRGRHRRGWGA